MAGMTKDAKDALKRARAFALGSRQGAVEPTDLLAAALQALPSAREALEAESSAVARGLHALLARPQANGLALMKPLGFSPQSQGLLMALASGEADATPTDIALGALGTPDVQELVINWGSSVGSVTAAVRAR